MNPYLCAIMALALTSTVSSVIKTIDIHPITLGICRLSIASSLFVLANKSKAFNIFKYKAEFRYLILLGICFGVHWVTYFYSIKIASASIGVIGVATFGIHLTIISLFILKIKPKKVDYFAVCLAISGVFLLISNGEEFKTGEVNKFGLALSVLSGFLYACLPILHKKIKNISTFERSLSQFFFALIVFLPFAFTTDFNTDWSFEKQDWIGIIYLSVVCTVVAHTLWIRATTVLNPVASSVIYYIGTPFALFLNYLVLGEQFGVKAIIGICMIYMANIIAFVWGSALKSKQ